MIAPPLPPPFPPPTLPMTLAPLACVRFGVDAVRVFPARSLPASGCGLCADCQAVDTRVGLKVCLVYGSGPPDLAVPRDLP